MTCEQLRRCCAAVASIWEGPVRNRTTLWNIREPVSHKGGLRASGDPPQRSPALRTGMLKGDNIGVTAMDDLNAVVEQSHLALGEFVKGNPEPLKALYSHKEDVSLANPFGPAKRGWPRVAETMEHAASLYGDGEVIGFESVAMCTTPELAYIVEVERYKARMRGRETVSPVALRVTSIFRPEDGTWKIVHRHADPITVVQPAESVVQG